MIPCLLKRVGDAQADIAAIIENLQRKDPDPIEDAKAFLTLRGPPHDMGTDEIARRIGKTQRFVQLRLQLLQLPDADQQRVSDKSLKVEDARRLAGQSAGGAKLPASRPQAPQSDMAWLTGTFGAADVLRGVLKCPGASAGALWSASGCCSTGLNSGAVYRLYKQLVDRGFARAYPGEITEKGLNALGELDPAFVAAQLGGRAPAKPPSDTLSLLDVIDQRASAGAAALEAARAGALGKVTEAMEAPERPIAARRAAAVAAAEARLAKARDAMREGGDIITGIRNVTFQEDWAPAAAADFLELVLEALRG